MPATPTHADLLGPLLDLAREAGQVILRIYASDFVVQGKADASPVTLADEEAERVILAGLARLDPHTPVVAEEAVAAGRIPQVGERFWLVDPLDGTREFVNRNGEFTVNIALVEHGEPVLGVVLVPVTGRLFAGAHGLGAFEVTPDNQRRAIQCRPVPAAGLTVLASRSHGDGPALDAWLATQRVAAVKTAGSSLKLCLLAAGEADVYPRFGRTMEWDIAAGHAVLAAAGGQVRLWPEPAAGHAMDACLLRYGKPGFENPHFVAHGRV
jgi:3'(2'), 5'-bisphosphate nucleotidase